jgi:hypothetical protein
MPVFPALGRLRQEDLEFEANLSTQKNLVSKIKKETN